MAQRSVNTMRIMDLPFGQEEGKAIIKNKIMELCGNNGEKGTYRVETVKEKSVKGRQSTEGGCSVQVKI